MPTQNSDNRGDHGHGHGNDDDNGSGNVNGGNGDHNSHEITCHFLGASRRNDTNEFPLEVSFTIGGIVYTAHFASQEEACEILQQHEDIRMSIASIKWAHANGEITLEESMNRLRSEWLPRVHSFAEDMGHEFVPIDIRWAVSDVEANIGVNVTAWEPLEVGVLLLEHE